MIISSTFRPSNVLFNEYGSLKLCDFGLAKRIVDLVQVEANPESGVSPLVSKLSYFE